MYAMLLFSTYWLGRSNELLWCQLERLERFEPARMPRSSPGWLYIRERGASNIIIKNRLCSFTTHYRRLQPATVLPIDQAHDTSAKLLTRQQTANGQCTPESTQPQRPCGGRQRTAPPRKVDAGQHQGCWLDNSHRFLLKVLAQS